MSFQNTIKNYTVRIEPLIIIRIGGTYYRYAKQTCSIDRIRSAFPAYAPTTTIDYSFILGGTYEGRLLEIQPFERKLSEASPEETTFDISQRLRFSLADPDETLLRETGIIGSVAPGMLRAQVWLFLKPRGGLAYVAYHGEIHDFKQRRGRIEIDCRSLAEGALETLTNYRTVSGNLFPYAAPADRDRMIPILYGALDSQQYGGHGLIKAFAVDGAHPIPAMRNRTFALASHEVRSVTRVFMDTGLDETSLNVTSAAAVTWNPATKVTTVAFTAVPTTGTGTLDGSFAVTGDLWQIQDPSLVSAPTDFEDLFPVSDPQVARDGYVMWVQLADGIWKDYPVVSIDSATVVKVYNPQNDTINGRPYVCRLGRETTGEIFVDVYGKVDSAGNLIENPVDVLADILRSHTAYPDRYMQNSQSPNYPFINTMEGVRGKLFDLGLKAAGVIDEVKSAVEIIEELCENFHLRLYPTQRSILPQISVYGSGLEVELLNVPTPMAEADSPTDPAAITWSMSDRHDILMGTWETSHEGRSLVNQGQYEWGRDWSGRLSRDYYRTAEQNNTESQSRYGGFVPARRRDLTWIQDSTTAFLVTSLMLWRFSDPYSWYEFETGLQHLTRELTTVGLLERRPWSGSRRVALERLELDCESFRTRLRFLDFDELHGDCFILGDMASLAATWPLASAQDRTFGYLADETTKTFSDGAPIRRLCP